MSTVGLKLTPLSEIPKIRDELRQSFRKGLTRPLWWRRNQLYQLARMVQDHSEEFTQALAADLGKPRQETYFGEIGLVVERCILSAERLEEWARPEFQDVPEWQKPWRPVIYKAAKGTVLVIAPWNFPMVLTLQPLLGAIGAGCCAVVKPSELAPNYAALLAELFPKYLDPAAFRIILGDVPETTRVLELQWDHRNGRVGRIIAAAAAKHLTPVTLELGGKSPIIIDPNYDIKLAAKRSLWGKMNNAGQICVCPDYAIVTRDKQDEFVAALREHYNNFFPDGALKSKSLGRIVSEQHHSRLTSLLGRTKGEIVVGGQSDDKRGLEPTVVRDVRDGDALMEEELFGPILPVVPVDTIEEGIELINSRPHPLIIYAFTDDPKVKQQILENTTSGNIAFNDTFQQLSVNELPFGGVGESGYGRQIMRYSFEGFTYQRSSIDMPRDAEDSLAVRYPPYTDETLKVMGSTVFLKIPDNVPPEN